MPKPKQQSIIDQWKNQELEDRIETKKIEWEVTHVVREDVIEELNKAIMREMKARRGKAFRPPKVL